MTTINYRYWAVVPAAGCGERMQSEYPKQYLPLAGKTVIEHALAPLLADERISKVVVVLEAEDKHWSTLSIASDKKIITAIGGAHRCQSVFNGLQVIADLANNDDWVLMHDAARPLLARSDIDKLIKAVGGHSVGGLLATPVTATLKRVDDKHEVLETVPRETLWQALTPQMFRFEMLYNAMEHCLPDTPTTDSAAAMEMSGHQPLIVPGRTDNIKITLPEDMQLAEQLLVQRNPS